MAAGMKLTAQEYAEIQNLYAYYNLCSDSGDVDGYASCFTEDGVLRLTGLGVEVRGRAAFVAWKQKDVAGRDGRYRRHWNGSIHLEKTGEKTVRGRCYLHAYNAMPGEPPELADAGVYEDTIVNVDGEWRFAERCLAFDSAKFNPPR